MKALCGVEQTADRSRFSLRAVSCDGPFTPASQRNFMNPTLVRARRLLIRDVLAALMCIGTSSIVLAAVAPMPPIADGVSVEHHSGKVIWADLVTPDLAAVE